MRFIILLISTITAIYTYAIDLEISLSETNHPIVGTRHIAVPICYDSVENFVVYTAHNGLFNIKAELKNKNIIYTILSNSDTIRQIPICQDSISNWDTNNTYDSHSVKFKYNNQTYYFIPGTKIQYNDSIYNQYPCMISEGEIKQGYFNANGSTIYILRNNYLKGISIFIKENGHFHDSEFFNGLNYKKEYSIIDTIPINNIPYTIEKLDWDSSKLSLIPINNRVNRKIDTTWLNYLFESNDNKEYVFIDFWGTWCAPCLKAIPKLKDLYISHNNNIGFLSICYDSLENITKYKEILNNYGIVWRNDFVSFNAQSSIVEYFKIESFPSFVLINKYGEIIFTLSGDSSLSMMDSLLKKVSMSN